MNDETKKTEFISFCIENYKMKLGFVSGMKVIDFFAEYGLLDFLLENYDRLHKLDKDRLMDEMERFLKKRGAAC